MQYWNVWFLIFYVMLKFLVWLACIFCRNIHFIIIKLCWNYGFSCITLCWNILIFMHYVMLKYLLLSLVLRYAEISLFPWMTLCWNIYFPLDYVMLKYRLSHALSSAEMSDLSCINIMLKYLFSPCITFCWNIFFLMCYVMLKYLVSSVLRYAEICSY